MKIFKFAGVTLTIIDMDTKGMSKEQIIKSVKSLSKNA